MSFSKKFSLVINSNCFLKFVGSGYHVLSLLLLLLQLVAVVFLNASFSSLVCICEHGYNCKLFKRFSADNKIGQCHKKRFVNPFELEQNGSKSRVSLACDT